MCHSTMDSSFWCPSNQCRNTNYSQGLQAKEVGSHKQIFPAGSIEWCLLTDVDMLSLMWLFKGVMLNPYHQRLSPLTLLYNSIWTSSLYVIVFLFVFISFMMHSIQHVWLKWWGSNLGIFTIIFYCNTKTHYLGNI